MAMVDDELVRAQDIIRAAARDPRDFTFDVAYMEPDPDGAGMFTVQYLVTIVHPATEKAMRAVGGIGSDWLGEFRQALADGYFD